MGGGELRVFLLCHLVHSPIDAHIKIDIHLLAALSLVLTSDINEEINIWKKVG